MKPYYDRDGITIYNCDCREILPELKADVVVTDPPYGVGLKFGENYSDAPEGYWDWLGPIVPTIISTAPLCFVTPGIANVWRWPRPTWILGWFKPGSTRRNGTGGFNAWEPVLQYGKRVQRVDAINLPDCANHDKAAGGHPCPKPVALFKWLIRACPDGGTVLDPFMGSGTTLVAAKLEGRKAIGIEIEERYCEIAAKRLAQGVLPYA